MSNFQPAEGWKFLTGDCNWEEYGGTWYKQAPDSSYWLLRYENRAEWGHGASGGYAQTARIDLNEVPPEEIRSALSSCGWELTDEGIISPHGGDVIASLTDDNFALVIVDALFGYGCYAPLAEDDEAVELDEYDDAVDLDEAAQTLMQRVAKAADEQMADETETERLLARPVNALGATAADFGQGNILGPLRDKAVEVVCGGQPELSTDERLVLQMYNACGGNTLGGKPEIMLAAAGKALRNAEEGND